MTAKDAETAILAATVDLMYQHPFFGCLIMQMPKIVADDIPGLDTMATDGRSIFFNSKFTLELKRAECVFVLAHEVMHKALLHHTRMGHRDPDRWNRATDYAINGGLIEAKVGKMPKGGLHRAEFDGLSAEKIYALLEKEDREGKKPEGKNGRDPGGCGVVMPIASPSDKATLEEAELETQVQIRQAVSAAKARNAGTLPGGIQRIVDLLLRPTIDWRAVLRRFIDQSRTHDYSWSKVNRRMMPHGYVFPGMVSTGISHIVLAVDTSGSINEKTLAAFRSEIVASIEEGAVDRATIVYADAKVQRHDVFEMGEDIVINAAGGGGTDFRDTMRFIRDEADPAAVVIYLTDLIVNEFGDEPDCPVLWAVYGDERKFDALAERTPFGEAIPISA